MKALHNTINQVALVPRYVSRFSCIGPDCEDNCCTGWRVSIDKKTFNAYRQSQNVTLMQRFKDDVRRVRSNANDQNYGRIELKPETSVCPFMEEKLCAVQRELGDSHLSNTCYSYPRLTRTFAGQVEQSLTLSCPEAARQALLQPDAFDFMEHGVNVRPGSVVNVGAKKTLMPVLMNEVRIFCMQLMRADGLELWQKLAVLGDFCQKLTVTLRETGGAGVPSLLEDYVAIVEKGYAIDALKELNTAHDVQAKIFVNIWNFKSSARSTSPLQNEVTRQILAGLGADPESGMAAAGDVTTNYVKGLSRLKVALGETPFLVEHYILNEMYQELFPFELATPFEDYLKLVSRYGVLRLMLAARCNATDELPSPLELAQVVQVFCRRFQHDTQFAAQVNTVLVDSGWAKLEMVYGLLRD